MKTSIPAAAIFFLSLSLILYSLGILVLPTSATLYAAAAIGLLALWLLFAGRGPVGKSVATDNTAAVKISELQQALDDAHRQAAQTAKGSTEAVQRAGHNEVLNFLSLLQTKGRLIDFLMDDVTKYPDQQVGAAARIIHQGCSSVIRDYFSIKPVCDDQEGAAITLDKEYDARSFRLLGRIGGEPPFRGKVLHHGWRTTAINLPAQTTATAGPAASGIIAPAEVELH